MSATVGEYTPLRLSILEQGKGLNFWQRLQLWPGKLIVGNYPSPMLVLSYHRLLYGKWFSRFLQQAMRKSSRWTKGELELFAAFSAQQLACGY